MRNLIRFLVRNNAFFLFLLLEGLSLWLIQRHQAYHHIKIVNSTNQITGGIQETYHDITGYFALRRINDSLQQEMAQARSGQLPPAYAAQLVKVDTVVDTIYEQRYTYWPVKVIASTVHHADNYAMLDRGTKDSVREGMGVIGPAGIVGKVVAASPHYAKVMTVLHRDFRAAVQLKRQGLRGALRWAPFSPTQAKLDYIVEPADLKLGDTIITSGASTYFPKGIVVGTIADFSLTPGENFYDITVDLATSFSSVRYGYVIKDQYLAEKDTLMTLE